MRLIKNISIVGLGAVMAQGLTALTLPILTRLYTPDSFSLWALFMSTSAIFSGMATMRYELAVVLPRDRTIAINLAIGGVGIAFVISIIAGLVMWILGPSILKDYKCESVGLWALLLAIIILSTAIYQIGLAWCTREAAFKTYAIAQFLLPFTILICQTTSAILWQQSGMGLITGTVGGQFICTCGIFFIVLWGNKKSFRDVHKANKIGSTLALYKQYPLFMTPYTLLGVTRERLAYFLIGKFGAADSVGFYSIATRLANLPNSLITSTLRPVFFHHAAEKNIKTLENFILISCRILGIIVIVFLAPCIAQATWLTKIILGTNWGEAAPYVVVLSIPMIPLLMGNWLDRIFDILGRQRTALILEFVFTTLAMIGLIGSYLIFRDLFFAICIQSGLLTIYYIFWLAMLFHIAGFNKIKLIWIVSEITFVGMLSILIAFGLAAIMPPAPAFAIALLVAMAVACLYVYRAWIEFGKINPARSNA